MTPRDEPCAAGKWRGGIGMVRTNRFLVDTIVTCEGERTESDAPWGIFGGHEGALAEAKITTPDGTVEHWPSKFTNPSRLAVVMPPFTNVPSIPDTPPPIW